MPPNWNSTCHKPGQWLFKNYSLEQRLNFSDKKKISKWQFTWLTFKLMCTFSIFIFAFGPLYLCFHGSEYNLLARTLFFEPISLILILYRKGGSSYWIAVDVSFFDAKMCSVWRSMFSQWEKKEKNQDLIFLWKVCRYIVKQRIAPKKKNHILTGWIRKKTDFGGLFPALRWPYEPCHIQLFMSLAFENYFFFFFCSYWSFKTW